MRGGGRRCRRGARLDGAGAGAFGLGDRVATEARSRIGARGAGGPDPGTGPYPLPTIHARANRPRSDGQPARTDRSGRDVRDLPCEAAGPRYPAIADPTQSPARARIGSRNEPPQGVVLDGLGAATPAAAPVEPGSRSSTPSAVFAPIWPSALAPILDRARTGRDRWLVDRRTEFRPRHRRRAETPARTPDSRSRR